MFTMPKHKNRKITDFTSKTTTPAELNNQNIQETKTKPSNKCPISPTGTSKMEREAKQRCLSIPSKKVTESSSMDKPAAEENPTLQAALGPLVKEFELLREYSVNTVHNDYTDLKKTEGRNKK